MNREEKATSTISPSCRGALHRRSVPFTARGANAGSRKHGRAHQGLASASVHRKSPGKGLKFARPR